MFNEAAEGRISFLGLQAYNAISRSTKHPILSKTNWSVTVLATSNTRVARLMQQPTITSAGQLARVFSARCLL